MVNYNNGKVYKLECLTSNWFNIRWFYNKGVLKPETRTSYQSIQNVSKWKRVYIH